MGIGKRRKWISCLVMAALFLQILPMVAMAEDVRTSDWQGSGTAEDAWRIATAQELVMLSERVNGGENFNGKYFQLVDDIDMTGKEWKPIGSETNTLFSGNFDGQGYTISGLTVGKGSYQYTGLFGQIKNGSVQNVVLDAPVLDGTQFTGAIAGSINTSLIMGCSVRGGKISGQNVAGGIAGLITDKSIVSDCDTSAVIEIDNTAAFAGGGIVGQAGKDSRITNCFNCGDINGNILSGGIVGYGHGSGITIENCFNKGSIPDNGYALLGGSGSGVTIRNSYYFGGQAAHPDTNVTADGVASVDANGSLSSAVSIAGQEYTNVADALNAWLSGKDVAARYWAADGFVPQYLVKFCGDEGNVLASVRVQAGQFLDEPTAPSKVGHRFVGWSGDGVTVWQFAQDVITQDMTFHPLWQVESVETSVSIQGKVGQMLSHDLKQNVAGDGAWRFALAQGVQLPAGLTLSEAGVLSGTPTETVQAHAVVCQASDANGAKINITMRLTIASADVAPAQYTICTAATVGGTITPERAMVAAGGSQTFRITAQNGYDLADVLLDDRSLGAVTSYTLTDVQADHLLEAHFVQRIWDDGGSYDYSGEVVAEQTTDATAKNHNDTAKDNDKVAKTDDDATETTPIVAANTSAAPIYQDMDEHWSREAVRFVSARGLMRGTAPETFAPDMPATKGTVAVILWRLAGEPETDNVGELWYEPAANWAIAQGLMAGDDLQQFAPENAITRQELATILFRLAGEQVASETLTYNFADAQEIAPWAAEAMDWAVQKGLLVGRADHTLAPSAEMTRAELAVVLARFIEKEEAR